MQDQLGQLGIGVEITEQPYDVDMYDDLSRWDAAFYFDFSVSGSGVPDTGLPTFLHTDGFANFGQISDPELDGLLDDLVVVGDDQGKRDELLRRIQELVVAEQAYVVDIALRARGRGRRSGLAVLPAVAGFVHGPQHHLPDATGMSMPGGSCVLARASMGRRDPAQTGPTRGWRR